MSPIATLRRALRIIESQRAEIETLKWLLEARRAAEVRDPKRPSRVRFGPSPTFFAHSPEFPDRPTEAARRRQARGGIGP